MDEHNENPSQFNSFINNMFHAKVVNFNKKLNLQDEQLSLPQSKHKCLNGSSSSKRESTFAEAPEAEKDDTCIIKGINEKRRIDYGSEPEPDSAKDRASAMYVLSSGRWSIKQENGIYAKEPTIDQEFEQYFSMSS